MNQRRGRIPDYLQKAYQPEYKRLDVEPMDVDPKITPNAPIRNFKVDPRPLTKRVINPAQTIKRAVPKGLSVPVHSGNNEDTLWVDGLEKAVAEPNGRVKVIDNDDGGLAEGEYIDKYGRITSLVNTEALQGYSQEEVQAYDENNSPVYAEDPNDIVEETPKQTIEDRFEPGDYIISFNNDVIAKSSNIDIVKKVVEDMVLRQNIDPNLIVVAKRIKLDFGVILG